MAKKTLVGIIGQTLSGAGETLQNKSAARQSIKQAKANINQLSVDKARSRYKTLTGVEIKPSRVIGELQGGFISKDVKNYMKLRDQQNTKLRKKFNI